MRKSFVGQMISKSRQALATLAHDTHGVSAVEFALILPVMITMYIGAVEFSHALTVDRRVTAVASAAVVVDADVMRCSQIQQIDFFITADAQSGFCKLHTKFTLIVFDRCDGFAFF